MFTTFFVGASAVIGGYQIIACGAKGAAAGAAALLKGRGIRAAATEFAVDALSPLAALPYATEQAMRSFNELGGEIWNASERLLKSMKKQEPASEAVVDGVATPSVPVVPTEEPAPAVNLQPA